LILKKPDERTLLGILYSKRVYKEFCLELIEVIAYASIGKIAPFR